MIKENNKNNMKMKSFKLNFFGNNEGGFEFIDLDSGQYTLSIQKSGYQANRKIVDVITGETVNTAISLSVIPSE